MVAVGHNLVKLWKKNFLKLFLQKLMQKFLELSMMDLKTAEKVLNEHKKAFTAIAHKLIEVETLEQEDYEKILVAHGILLKKKRELVAVQ